MQHVKKSNQHLALLCEHLHGFVLYIWLAYCKLYKRFSCTKINQKLLETDFHLWEKARWVSRWINNEHNKEDRAANLELLQNSNSTGGKGTSGSWGWHLSALGVKRRSYFISVRKAAAQETWLFSLRCPRLSAQTRPLTPPKPRCIRPPRKTGLSATPLTP